MFNGLRVRMGATSGYVPADAKDVASCCIVAKAKLISDMGAGGEVLLDEETFRGVKDCLHELGCVDEHGINLSELDTAAWRTLFCPWRSAAAVSSTPEAVLLDMGAYRLPQQQLLEIGAAACQVTNPLLRASWLRPLPAAAPAQSTGSKGPPGSAGDSQLESAAAKIGRSAATPSSRSSCNNPSVLRIYQVLHPMQVARAHVYGNDLACKDILEVVDLPYFDAPDIAMVFARVDGGKQLMLRDKTEGLLVNGTVLAVIAEALKAVPGGYLCRVQDGEMKYMVAFHDAQDALEWALVVQELLVWQSWSQKLLAQAPFLEVVDEATELPLFRGPRMKMGVCQGSPRTIMPDHLGRADYHGASINQAARYMEVAAHGGQVVCDMALAAQVAKPAAVWAAAARERRL
eukprot:gene8470-8653_t